MIVKQGQNNTHLLDLLNNNTVRMINKSNFKDVVEFKFNTFEEAETKFKSLEG